jgi:hypothetical protein
MTAVKAAPGAVAGPPDYLLAHCGGFCVETADGTLGYVEEVVCKRSGWPPTEVRVRTGYGGQASSA